MQRFLSLGGVGVLVLALTAGLSFGHPTHLPTKPTRTPTKPNLTKMQPGNSSNIGKGIANPIPSKNSATGNTKKTSGKKKPAVKSGNPKKNKKKVSKVGKKSGKKKKTKGVAKKPGKKNGKMKPGKKSGNKKKNPHKKQHHKHHKKHHRHKHGDNDPADPDDPADPPDPPDPPDAGDAGGASTDPAGADDPDDDEEDEPELTTGRGLLVTDLDEKGPAAQAGLDVDDTILSVNGTRVQTVDELRAVVEKATGPVKVVYISDDTGDMEEVVVRPRNGRIGLTMDVVELEQET